MLFWLANRKIITLLLYGSLGSLQYLSLFPTLMISVEALGWFLSGHFCCLRYVLLHVVVSTDEGIGSLKRNLSVADIIAVTSELVQFSWTRILYQFQFFMN